MLGKALEPVVGAMELERDEGLEAPGLVLELTEADHVVHPLLEGLEGDLCQCPHWGYLIEGRIRVSYQDGTQETVSAGDKMRAAIAASPCASQWRACR